MYVYNVYFSHYPLLCPSLFPITLLFPASPLPPSCLLFLITEWVSSGLLTGAWAPCQWASASPSPRSGEPLFLYMLWARLGLLLSPPSPPLLLGSLFFRVLRTQNFGCRRQHSHRVMPAPSKTGLSSENSLRHDTCVTLKDSVHHKVMLDPRHACWCMHCLHAGWFCRVITALEQYLLSGHA